MTHPGSESLEADPKTNIGIGLFCSALVLSTCLINPASSLARFIPQMWLLPIFAFFIAYFSKNQLIRIVGYAIIMTLLLNNALVAFAYYKYNSEITGVYHQRLGKMAQESKENPVEFHFGHFRTGNVWRFEQLGINFEVVERKEECKNGAKNSTQQHCLEMQLQIDSSNSDSYRLNKRIREFFVTRPAR